MLKVSRLSGGYAWALGLAGAGLSLILLHELFKLTETELAQTPLMKILPGSLAPVGAELRAAQSLPTNDLMAQLEEADRQWQPQEEIQPDGTTHYLYKRRTDEPDLSVTELRKLIESPPTFHKERQAVLHLLQALQSAGVRVHLSPTIKKGAAAEWDHRQGTLRIQPHMSERGSVDFLQVLNHEAIHVAQSCRAGSLTAKPKPLGLNVSVNYSAQKKLNDPIYMGSSQWEKDLELEAYGSQNNSKLVKKVLTSECNPSKLAS